MQLSPSIHQRLIEVSPYPVYYVEGPGLILKVANKATLDAWGKDASVVGLPFALAIPELYGKPFGQLIQHVMDTGEMYEASAERVDIRVGTVLSTFYFNYIYQPVYNERQQVEGVVCFATDVTDIETLRQAEKEATEKFAVAAEEVIASNEELNRLNDELEETRNDVAIQNLGLVRSESRLRYLLADAPIAIAVFNGPHMVIESANKKMLEAWGKTSRIIGHTLSIAVPELEGQEFAALLNSVYRTGVPFYGDEMKAMLEHEGVLEEVYSNFVYQPLKERDGSVNGIMVTANVVTEQVKARKKIEQTELSLRLAVEAANLGSWFIEPATMRLTYNTALARIFGYHGSVPMTFEQALGQVSEEHRLSVLAQIEQAIDLGGDYDITYPQRKFDDDSLIWLRSIGRVTASQDGPTLFSGFVMDITEQKKDEQRKSDFIAMVSHELKTPLTSISGYIQMLQIKMTKAADHFTTNALEKTSKQIRKMTRLINGFLDISRLESGKINLEQSHFRLDELVQQAVIEARQLNPGCTIIYSGCNRPPVVTADYDKISNVLSNLLSNAVKYSPEAGEIHVMCESEGSTGRISVRDTGIGISNEHQQKLFQRYFRVQSNIAVSGFGIGLYLSKEIIERHKGEIGVTSELGTGSTFWFTLPLFSVNQ